MSPNGEHPSRGAFDADVIRLGVMAACIVFSLLNRWSHWLRHDWVALGATFIGGWPVFAEAWRNLLKRKMTMELSMTIALVAAVAVGEFLTAAVIAFFVLFAERVEAMTVAQGRRALGELMEALPRTVLVLRDGKEVEVPAEEVAAGAITLTRPGERIATDGVVLKGHSSVNEASITGEPLPVEKEPGSQVYAGTLNEEGALEIRAERTGRDTTFGRIVEIVEEAERSKAPLERVADRLATLLVGFALVAALVSLALTRNVQTAISMVLVVGACGVAAGTPLALLAGLGQAARRGIIIKGGVYLEQLDGIDTVILDKTGTLTLGMPEVKEVIAVNGVDPQEVLALTASAETASEHPLGRAILRRAREQGLTLAPLEHFHYIPGRGLVCTLSLAKGGSGPREIMVGSRRLLAERGVDLAPYADFLERADPGFSKVFVAEGTRALGVVVLGDKIRPGAAEAIATLNRRGLRTILLSGDADATAKKVGDSLGISESHGGLLPQDKLEWVHKLMKAGNRVVMVGDGVNDAPALAAATVGVAMGQGTDVALATADVTLMRSNLNRFVEMFTISHRCLRVIRFNFWGTLGIDSVGIALAWFGFIGPVEAALIHVGSELGFILNSARLFRWR